MSEEKTIDDGGLAFPAKRYQAVDMFVDADGATRPTFADVDHPGMSLRDWFAGQALSNIPLRDWSEVKTDQGKIGAWASCAYAVADAMIAARKGGV